MSKTLNDVINSKEILYELFQTSDFNQLRQFLLKKANEVNILPGRVNQKKEKMQETIVLIREKITTNSEKNNKFKDLYTKLFDAIEQSKDWPLDYGWGPVGYEQTYINCKFICILGEVINELSNQIDEA